MNKLEFTSSLRVQYSYDCVPQMHCWNALQQYTCISFSAAMEYSCLLLCKAMIWAHMHAIQIYTEHPLMLILISSPSNFLQNLRLGKIPVDSLLFGSQRDNTV